jgi:hypothetical protein
MYISDGPGPSPFIFESPDRGKTVYRRRFGDYSGERELVQDEGGILMTDEKWERIQDHCRKFSAEMLEWQKEEFDRWGSPWSDREYHTDQDDIDESCVGC